MSTRSRLTAAAALTLFAGAAFGDGINNPTTQFVGNMGEGVSNPIGVGGTPVTPCSGGQFDFSAGCNAIFFTGVMTP